MLQAAKQVSDILVAMHEELWTMVGSEVTGLEGSVNYCSLWSPGRTMGFDCDISCCLSPRQFEELFLPPLTETMRTVEHRSYHLDGTVALQHLDLLLSVPELQAILQWVPLIRRIQPAGEAAQVYCGAQDVPARFADASRVVEVVDSAIGRSPTAGSPRVRPA